MSREVPRPATFRALLKELWTAHRVEVEAAACRARQALLKSKLQDDDNEAVCVRQRVKLQDDDNESVVFSDDDDDDEPVNTKIVRCTRRAKTEDLRGEAEITVMRVASGVKDSKDGSEDATCRQSVWGSHDITPMPHRSSAFESVQPLSDSSSVRALDPNAIAGQLSCASRGSMAESIVPHRQGSMSSSLRRRSLEKAITVSAEVSLGTTDHIASRRTSLKGFNLREYWRPGKKHLVDRRISFAKRSTGLPQTTKSEQSLLVTGNSFMQPFMVHPSSVKRILWDLVSMTILGYDLMAIPFVDAFDPERGAFLTGMVYSTLIFWTLDMPASLITGYQQGKQFIMKPSSVLLHYLRTWFLLDLVLVALDWFSVLINDPNESQESGNSAARLGRTLRTLRFVRTLRLVRVWKLKRAIQAIQDSINTEAISILFGISKIIISLVVANHVVACGWYAVGLNSEESDMSWIKVWEMKSRTLTYKYMTSLHWSLTQFTPASMEVMPVTTGERIYTVIVILFAMIAFSSFVSVLTASMAQLQNLSSNESRQFWLLRRYLRDWGVRRNVGIRVQRYLEYAYQKQKCRVQESEVKVLQLLSEPLRLELKHETFSHYLCGHPLFHLCCEARVFGKALVSNSLATGDLLFICGEKAQRVIFLTSGVLEYRPGLYEETDHDDQAPGETLTEFMWISEAVLWVDWHHLGDLEAWTECQVIGIDAYLFGEGIQQNVPVLGPVRKYAEKFVDLMNAFPLEELTDLAQNLFSPEDALAKEDFQCSTDRVLVEDEEKLYLFVYLNHIWNRLRSAFRKGGNPLSSATAVAPTPQTTAKTSIIQKPGNLSPR